MTSTLPEPPHPAPETTAALDGIMAIYGALTASLPAAEEEAVPGAELGNCRLCERLAEGGMGVVWRAEQLAPVQREVAVKILKLGMDTVEFVRRFRIELEALARLEHPHIARVYDAGMTPRGRPFLVMELVRGAEPVTVSCQRRGADLRARLAVFADICAAVQYAHQRGVIHRDLKPSNLLVSKEDALPHPVVIDFGVARAADPSGEGVNVTEPGRLLGTPAYMSPEQMNAGEAATDTRTDIYALGCVLYELITGQPPFDHERIRTSSLAELARLLRDEMPPSPSERLRRAGDSAAAARVRGELDWIVMKALAKDPERRYRTAADFEEDVRRYLRGDTVTARPSSLAYRMRKFSSRHKPAVAASLVVLISLLAMTGVSLQQARREAHERQNAEAILRFFDEDLVTAAREAADASGTADPLDAAARRITAEFGDRPVLAARLRTTLGRAYLKMGDPARAADHLPDALQRLTKELGAGHSETLRAAAGVAEWHYMSGNFAESARQWKEVRRVMAIAGDSPEQREAALGYAQALGGAGENAESARLLTQLHDQTRGVTRQADREFFSRVALAFAVLEERRGDLARADRFINDAVEEREGRLGPAHPVTLAAVKELARLREKRGDYAAALTLLRRSFDGLRTALGAGHPRAAAAQKTLAEACERLGDETTALSLSIAAGHALASSGRDHEAIESFLTAARLSQHSSLPEAADRWRATAWSLSRRLGLPADGPWLPRGHARQFPDNLHWYQRFEVPMSWTDAEAACRALGGHLATATTEAENTFLYLWTSYGCVCWLGASLDPSGKWQWVTGEPFSWSPWAEGEPSNTGNAEHFVNFGNSTLTFFRKGSFWNDHPDAGEFSGWLLTYPVCEWESPATPPPLPAYSATAAALPRTSSRYFACTGHWYARINVPMPWTEAVAVCKALGGRLACAGSPEENEFLFAEFASDRLCWLGGTNRNVQGTWRWEDGRAMDYAPWAEGEPNNTEGFEHFTQFGNAPFSTIRSFGAEWNDAADDGTWQTRFLTYPVCEWDQPPPGPAPASQ